MSQKFVVTLVGTAPYSQSRMKSSAKNDGEDDDVFERRTWKEHAHINPDGFVYIPEFALKTMLDATAQYLGDQIPGKGKRTYTAIFRSGMRVNGDPILYVRKTKDDLKGHAATIADADMTTLLALATTTIIKDLNKHCKRVTAETLIPEWISANSDGKRGGSRRVPRCYPNFYNWFAVVEFDALDPRITEKVFNRHIVAAGIYMGVGRYRAGVGGSFGRFEVYVNGKKIEADVQPTEGAEERMEALADGNGATNGDHEEQPVKASRRGVRPVRATADV